MDRVTIILYSQETFSFTDALVRYVNFLILKVSCLVVKTLHEIFKNFYIIFTKIKI